MNECRQPTSSGDLSAGEAVTTEQGCIGHTLDNHPFDRATKAFRCSIETTRLQEYRPRYLEGAVASRLEANGFILASVAGRRSPIPGILGNRFLILAALVSAYVRSQISEGSCCTTAPSTCSQNMP